MTVVTGPLNPCLVLVTFRQDLNKETTTRQTFAVLSPKQCPFCRCQTLEHEGYAVPESFPVGADSDSDFGFGRMRRGGNVQAGAPGTGGMISTGPLDGINAPAGGRNALVAVCRW